MEATVQTVRTPQMVHTRPRGTPTGPNRQTISPDTGSDPFADTQTRRAVARPAPAPVGIVVTGDNHLSAALPRLSAERRRERRERLRAGFSAAVDYALQHGARLLVIAGDLFDTAAPTNAERSFVAGELARLRRANILCVGVSGAHDSPRRQSEHSGGESPHHTYAALDGMTYFPATTALAPRLVTLGDLRLAVAGVSTDPAASRGSDPLAGVTVSDPEGVLARADVGLLIIHAGVEGFARRDQDERIVTRASLDALPAAFRVVVAGHIHRFGRAHVGEREIIVPGSTERMDFDSQPGSSGFAWLEVGGEGLVRVKRIAVAEQPRADVMLTTDRLFPGDPATDAPGVPDENSVYPIPALPILTPNGRHTDGAIGDELALRELSERDRVTNELLATVRAALDEVSDEVSTEETIVRLRLVGPISRDQYHRLPLRQILHDGAQHAFSFELDTSGLELIEPSTVLASGGSAVRRAAPATGPLSPNAEVERLLSDRLAQVPANDPATVADLRAAASILLARLRASGESQDREAQR